MIRRRLGLSVGLVAAYLAIGSCGREITGPERVTGAFVFAPSFANVMGAEIVDIAFIRVVLTPPGGARAVIDTVFPPPSAAGSITLTFTVPVSGSTAPYVLRVAMTNTQGDTVFRIGPVTVEASASANPAAQEVPPAEYVGVGANATGVRFVSVPATAAFNKQVVIVAEAFDGQGAAIPGTPIGFELVNLADSTRASFADPGVGTLTTNAVRGPIAIRAVLLTGQTAEDTVTVIPVASGIEVVSGNAQSAIVGTGVAQPLVARVTADDDLGVPDVAVRFRLIRGVDTLFVSHDTSAANGDVSYTPVLGQTSGAYSVSVEAADLAIGGATFTATANAGAAFALEFTGQPPTATAAEPLSPAVQVTARDAFGNVATSFVGSVTVSLLSSPERTLLSGAVMRAAVAGVATFNDIEVDRVGAGLKLLAESGALVPDTSLSFAVTVGAATQAAFSIQPPLTSRPSTPFTVEVEVRDAGGNVVPGFSGPVTLALATNPASGTLTGTTVVAASAGIALFNDLRIDNFGVGYRLSATVPGVTAATSNPLDVTLPGGVNAWTSLSGGNWGNPANWSLGTVPTAADTVWIKQSGTYTVVLDAAITMARVEIGAPLGTQTLSLSSPTITLGDTLFVGDNGRFTMTGGVINGTGAIIADGAFVWTGGNLTGGSSARVNAGGTLTIAGTSARTLNDFQLELAGTGTWSGTHTIASGSAAAIRVLPSGTLDIQGGPSWLYNEGGAQSVLDVQGALIKSVSSATAIVPGLSVSGTVNVLTGVLQARNAGTSTGTIAVAPAATLRFAAGTQTLAVGSLVEGGGLVDVSTSGIVNANGGWAVTGITRVSSGQFNFNGTGTTADFELIGGAKAGAGTFEIAGAMTWTGGHLWGGNGVTRVLAGGTLLIDGATTRSLNAHQLEVAGAGVWTDSAQISSGSSGVLRVLPSGTFDMQGDGRWKYNEGGAQSTFEVQGAAMRTVSTDTVFVPGLTVSGTLLVSTGVLEARNAGTSSGTLTAGAGGELRFAGGMQTMTATSRVDGAGLVVIGTGATVSTLGDWAVAGTTRIAGGGFDFDSPTGSTDKLDVAGGLRGGAGTLTVTDSMRWTGGDLSAGGGTTRVETGAVLEMSGGTARSLNGQTLEIAGTAAWSGAHTIHSGSLGTLRVAVGGVLYIQGDPRFQYDQGGAASILQNLGSIVRSSGTGSVYVSAVLQQSGALSINTGTFDISGGGSLGGAVAIAAGANLIYKAGTYALQPDYQTTGLGYATLDGATLDGLAAGDTVRFDRLTLLTGSLSPAAGGVVRIVNSAFWTGSTSLTGGGSTHIANGAVLQLQGTATRSLNNHTLTVEGSALWEGAFSLHSGSSGRFRVMPSGLLSIQHPAATTASFYYNEGGPVSVLDVQGDLAVVSTGNFNVSTQLQHTGTTVLTEGITTFAGGGTLGGTLSLAAAASLNLAGGPLTLADQLAITGQGLTTLTGGTLSVAAATDTAVVGRLRLNAGVVDPNGVIVVTDHLEWAGSTSITGGTLVAADTLLISGTAPRSLNTGTLETRGVSRWIGSLNINTGSLGRLRNMPGAEFQWESPANFLFNEGGTSSVFENQGAMVFSTTGTAQITSSFIDTLGTGITVQSGTVSLAGGGRIGNGSIVHTEGPLQFSSGTFSLKNGAEFTAGAGMLRLMMGAAITTDSLGADSVTIQRFELAGGLVNHEGKIAIVDEMIWSSGSLTSNDTGLGGTTRIGAGASLDISGAGSKSFSGLHTLDIVAGGLAEMTSSAVLNTGAGSVIQNAGQFNLRGTGPINFNLGGTASRFRNLASGVLDAAGVSTGAIGVPIENAGGTLVSSGSALVLAAGSVTNFYGTVASIVAPLSLGGAPFALTGGLSISGTAGNLTVTGTSLALGANTLTMSGDLVVGAGATINSSNAAALLDVGGDVTFAGAASTMSAGELRVGGGFTQSAAGATNSFNATGTHRTHFKGSGGQQISFATPANSRFNILTLGSTSSAGSVELLTAVTATQFYDAIPVQQDTIASANGSPLTVTGIATMDSIVFAGARLALTNATGGHSIAGIRFDAMDPASTYLKVQMNPGIVVTIERPYFATAPTSGYYVEARQLAIGAPARVHLTAPVFPSSPLLRYLLTPASSSFPEVLWDTQLNPGSPP